MFAPINNKKEEGYNILFKKINNILTIEETKELKLISYTTDFEKGLINSLSNIFKNSRAVGCYYHYTRTIREKAREYELFNKANENTAKELLTILYKAPFTIIKNKNILTETCEKYSEKGDKFNNFLDYFKNQWMIYFNNGMLNYSGLSKSQRSNSYIENYNRIIKLKLSKFLYGKNRCKITWPMFFYFIKNEENDKQNEIKKLKRKFQNLMTKFLNRKRIIIII